MGAAGVVEIHGAARTAGHAGVFDHRIPRAAFATAKCDDFPIVAEDPDPGDRHRDDQRGFRGNRADVSYQRFELIERMIREAEGGVLCGDKAMILERDVDDFRLTESQQITDFNGVRRGGDHRCRHVSFERGFESHAVNVLDLHLLDFPGVFDQLLGSENLLAVRLTGMDIIVAREIVVLGSTDIHPIPALVECVEAGQAVDAGI